jgi:cytochrome c oxidase subunit 2
MNAEFSLFPEEASSAAPAVDALFFFIVGVSLFFATITAVLVVYYSLRYRRKSPDHYPPAIHGSNRMEVLWAGFLLVLFLVIFFWGAFQALSMVNPPDDAMEVYVVGKQWMWQMQHPEGGQREINELHVPVGKPVKLIMTSEDVIHSFFIPAFRVKQDVLPVKDRFTYLYFTPTKTGNYHLFCAQYCGTQHSRMIGWVHVMEPSDYGRWLGGKADLSMALRGRQLFLKYQCIACHGGDSQARAPLLEELYGKTVTLTDGRVVDATEDYLRRSIRDPKADIVSPYQPIMPAFGPDQMDDLQLQQLVEFIKTLGRNQTPTRNEFTPAPEQRDQESGVRSQESGKNE